MMKFFKALVFAVIPWYPIALFISYVTYDVMQINYAISDGVALIGSSIISIFIFSSLYKERNISLMSTMSTTISAVKDIKDSIEFDLEEKSADFYAKAEEEYDKGEVNKGLWSQAFIKSKGDESLRKLEYMKLRVKQLKKNT